MSGYCATGIAPMARAPASVMTIETTNASRGRSMKISEIISSARSLQSCFLHDLARPHFLNAVDDHVFAFMQTRGDDHVGIAIAPGLHAALFDLVLIVDDQDVIAGLVGLQRCLRNNQLRLLRALPDHRGHVLAVDQLPVGVWN